MGVRQLIRGLIKLADLRKCASKIINVGESSGKFSLQVLGENCKSHMKTWKRLKKRWGWGIINNNLFLMKGEILSYPSSRQRKLVFFVIQATKLNLLNNMVPKKGILRCIKDRITTCTKEIIKLHVGNRKLCGSLKDDTLLLPHQVCFFNRVYSEWKEQINLFPK